MKIVIKVNPRLIRKVLLLDGAPLLLCTGRQPTKVMGIEGGYESVAS